MSTSKNFKVHFKNSFIFFILVVFCCEVEINGYINVSNDEYTKVNGMAVAVAVAMAWLCYG